MARVVAPDGAKARRQRPEDLPMSAQCRKFGVSICEIGDGSVAKPQTVTLPVHLIVFADGRHVASCRPPNAEIHYGPGPGRQHIVLDATFQLVLRYMRTSR